MPINVNSATYDTDGVVIVSWESIRFEKGHGFVAQIRGLINPNTTSNIIISDASAISCEIPFRFAAGNKYDVIVFGLDKKGFIIVESASKAVNILPQT